MDLFDLALYRALNKGGGGGDITVEPLTVTANGQYAAPSGKAYSPVGVNVQPTLQSKTVTENGTVTADSGYDGLSSVVVDVSGGGVQSGYTPPSNASGADGDLYVQIAKDGILRSDGYCYIDTLIFPRATYWAMVDFCMNETTSNYDTVYGTRNAGVGRFTARFDASTTGYLILHMSPSPSLAYNTTTLPLRKDSLNKKFATVTYKAQLDDADNNAFPYTLYLFANNDAGSPSDYAVISVKRFCLFDENDVCILYMVPAKDQNDVACMYDLISGNYYYNSGDSTSHFTYTDLESEKLAVIWQKTNGAWVPVATN